MTLPTITVRTDPVPRHDDPLAQASLCSLCPKLCRPTCPVQHATGREAVAPWRISDAVVRGVSSGWTLPLAEQVASCTGCLACASPCLPGTNLPEESRAARAAAANAGAVLPAAIRVRERIAASGTPRRWSPPDVPGEGTRLFLGCPSSPEIAAAALALFAAAGEPISCAADERCCGAVPHDLGLAPEATALATAAGESLAGADRVVVASPGCARMMREEWPRLGLASPPVVTAVEWLASVVSTLAVTGAAGVAAWHPPCVLSRGLGVVEEPLRVLAALGYEVRETAAARCSGAGAAYPMVDADGAASVAAVRRAELDALGAPAVTACPSAGRALGATDLLVLTASRLAG